MFYHTIKVKGESDFSESLVRYWYPFDQTSPSPHNLMIRLVMIGVCPVGIR